MNNIIEYIENLNLRLKKFLPERKRLYYSNLKIDNLRGVIIYGSRGVGKTTFLIDKIKNRNFLYFSADTPLISSVNLYNLVNQIFMAGYEGVVIDEIHFANEWSIHLKSLYDDFPDKKIWVSDSSNLMLREGIGDLSRRFVQFKIPFLSFREYLYIKTGTVFPVIDFFKIDEEKLKEYYKINHLKYFKDYLYQGTRPIFEEGEYCRRIKGIVEKTIYSDIPFHLKTVNNTHIRVVNAILGHLLYASVPTLNISKMCTEWSIGKEKLYGIFEAMHESDVIRILKTKNNKNFLTKGSKIFLSDPSLYYCYDGEKGNIREAFTAMIFSEKYKVFCSEKEEHYDFLIDNKKIEVGGKNKKLKKADFVLKDDIEIPLRNNIPLWVAGTIY